MSASSAIYAKLSGDAGIDALVDGRIFPQVAPGQITGYPRIMYELEDREDVTSYTGAATANLSKQSFTIACVARSYTGMRALAELVKASLDEQSGTWGGTVVQGVFFEDEREENFTTEAGQDDRFWVKELDFVIWFQPS